jgi:CheY-like chemotaxis protein/anti-sigma regulatory factor (Ser/Thr protein kinase)
MSHELRTPMNAVIGYSEMLAEEMADAGDDDYIPDVQKVQAAGKHLLGLINDVLDLSKIEAGRMDLYLERFDLREMLDEAVATVTPLVGKNGNALVAEFDDELGSMRADLTKVRQSLFNLLSNAAKFTHQGTVRLAAQRRLEAGSDRITLSVSDTGIGIPPEKLEHVFEEFSQADDSTTRNFGGTGLGLAISRRFCQMMGGDITVTSRVGEGSTFRIELPASVDALEAAKAASVEGGQTVELAGEDARQVALASGPALVIDDQEEARDLLRRTLEGDGFEVRTAESGEEGLALARELAPCVITLDVMMPGMDGWEVLRRLKADPETQHIPVVMVSIIHEKGLGYSLGAAEYLTKPVDRSLLLHLVAKYGGKGAQPLALIVEDDETGRELVRRTLEGEGWRVDEAENGAVGLQRAEQQTPDLVILDLMMPVMDGFEFLRELRRSKSGRDVPVVVLTAKELDPDEREFLNQQAETVLSKDSDTLEAAVEQVRAAVAERTRGGA